MQANKLKYNDFKYSAFPNVAPCPCCGFIFPCSKNYTPGGYDICHVCDWEDDPPSLNYLFKESGANHNSIEYYQQKLVNASINSRIMSTQLEYEGQLRDPLWFPVCNSEMLKKINDSTYLYWTNENFIQVQRRLAKYVKTYTSR